MLKEKCNLKKGLIGLLVLAVLTIIMAIPVLAKEYGDETVYYDKLQKNDILTSDKTKISFEGKESFPYMFYYCDNQEYAREETWHAGKGGTYTEGEDPFEVPTFFTEEKLVIDHINNNASGPFTVFLYPYQPVHTHTFEITTDKSMGKKTMVTAKCMGCEKATHLYLEGTMAEYTGKPVPATLTMDEDFMELLGITEKPVFLYEKEGYSNPSEDAPVEAGIYVATASFMYDGKVYMPDTSVEITKAQLKVTGLKEQYEYTGQGISLEYHVYGVDGKELKEGVDYYVSIDEGKAENQTPGNHTIKFISYDSNYENAEFTYKIVKSDNPLTGDTNSMMLFVIIAGLAAALAVSGGLMLRRKGSR